MFQIQKNLIFLGGGLDVSNPNFLNIFGGLLDASKMGRSLPLPTPSLNVDIHHLYCKC